MDLIASPSVASIYEGFADLTLLFGLLPGGGDISVIGVGWFVGLIFVFYLCFPFFCYLLENRKRAWTTFGISLIYNFVCCVYFDVGRQNILYSGCFFMAGGLVYLYRSEIVELAVKEVTRWLVLATTIVSVVAYYAVGANTITYLLVSVMLLIYSIQKFGGVLDNRITKFFGGISMEIYLSHMVIFRGFEKLHLNTALGNGWLQYAVTVVMVIVGASVFAFVVRQIIGALAKNFSRRLIG